MRIGDAVMRGVIKRVMYEKKFGFLLGEDGNEYFFHMSDYRGDFEFLHVDLREERRVDVEFSVVPSIKGPRAGNVVPTAKDSEEDHPRN